MGQLESVIALGQAISPGNFNFAAHGGGIGFPRSCSRPLSLASFIFRFISLAQEASVETARDAGHPPTGARE